MDLKELFTEDRGVSPVIGVILMVAITVILAAVIGAFVLGLGDRASDSAPSASWSYDFTQETNLTISHDGGDNVDSSELRITLDGDEVFPDTDEHPDVDENPGWTDDETLRTGDEIEFYNSSGEDIAESGDTVRIIWEAPGGGSTNTLSDRNWP